MEEQHLAVKAEVDYGDPFSWLYFIFVIVFLLVLDITCLTPPINSGRMSFPAAVKLTLFWISTGLVFNLSILGYLGWEPAVGFLHGLILEYMLSFDNLFVFHLVFAYYCTPEHLLYRALYFGIAGAIVFRMIFLVLGSEFMGTGLYLVKFAFGAVLIWSGIKTANDTDDEDTTDPTNNRFISWVTKHLPVSDNYDSQGRFFVTVAEVECRPPRSASAASEDDLGLADEESSLGPPTISDAGPTFPRLESFEGSSLLEPQQRSASRGSPSMDQGNWRGRVDSAEFEVTRTRGRLRRKASLLFLVVVAVWVVDLIFAVDSVASKLGVVNSVYLNCSSSAFAMLSLRSLYFVMENLVEMFQMLKYGIASILILIGLKLVFSGIVNVSNTVCFAVVLAIMAASIASSYWMPRFRDTCERMDDSMAEDFEAERRDPNRYFANSAMFERETSPGGRAVDLASSAGKQPSAEAASGNSDAASVGGYIEEAAE